MKCKVLYVTNPIDHFEGLVPFPVDEGGELAEFKRTAFAMAKHWEGDFRAGPFQFCIPYPNAGGICVQGILWKQDNNGTTFIGLSEDLDLPHLLDESYEDLTIRHPELVE